MCCRNGNKLYYRSRAAASHGRRQNHKNENARGVNPRPLGVITVLPEPAIYSPGIEYSSTNKGKSAYFLFIRRWRQCKMIMAFPL